MVGRTIGVVAAAAVLLGVWIAPARASGWVYPAAYWSVSGSNVHVWGRAYAHDYGCGLKDCAYAKGLYFQAGRLGGKWPQASRTKASVYFGGVGLNVSVSYPLGVSVGFYDAGSSCDHGWWESPGAWVSVDFGDGKICQASTWGWVSNMSLGTSGGVRFGGSWSARAASANISLGGA